MSSRSKRVVDEALVQLGDRSMGEFVCIVPQMALMICTLLGNRRYNAPALASKALAPPV